MSEPSGVDEYPFETPELIGLDGRTIDDINKLIDEDAVVTGSAQQPFKIAGVLRGMEDAKCDFLSNEPIIERIYDHLYGFYTAYCVALAEARVDVRSRFRALLFMNQLCQALL